MPKLDSIFQSNSVYRPRKTVCYGVKGVGKSTFASMTNKPIFIPCEDGLRDLNVPQFPLAKSWVDIMESAWSLYADPHDFGTLVIDTIDWAERLCWTYLCERAGKESISDFGFGKGYSGSAVEFGKLLGILHNCCVDRNMEILILGHARSKKFDDPLNGPYDRYSLRVHEAVQDMLEEWCDELIFANYEVFVKKEGEGFSEVKLGVGNGHRVIYTTERPSHKAKNRLGLPDKMNFDWREYSAVVQEKVRANRTPFDA